MYSLFALLLRKSYWQMLFRKATWHEAWLNLQRAHKDRRARRHLRQLGVSLIIPLVCLVYAAWLLSSGAIFLIPVIGFGIWWSNHKRREDQVSLSILPEKPPAFRALSAEEQKTVRTYFAELALVYAVMLSRAGSEAYLKEKVLPEGFEVISRRTHLDLLKSTGLWDKMHPDDRESMMMPDGHWEPERIHYYYPGLEPLRLLRWILRVDYYLPALGYQLHLDLKLATELVAAPRKVLDGKDMVTLKLLDTARESASVFFHRCYAEEIARGYREANDPESAEWASRVTAAMAGKQHEDLILGDKLVSEAGREELVWATRLALRRMIFLNFAGVTMDKANAPQDGYAFLP